MKEAVRGVGKRQEEAQEKGRKRRGKEAGRDMGKRQEEAQERGRKRRGKEEEA